MKTLSNILFCTLCFAVGWLTSARWRTTEVVERVRVDTVFYERPKPFSVSSHYKQVNLPRVIYVDRADTVVIARVDTVAVPIKVEQIEYTDSLYHAVLSGPTIGDLHPRLEEIEVYGRTVTRTVSTRPRWAVTVGVGVSATPKGIQPAIGVQAGIVLWSR